MASPIHGFYCFHVLSLYLKREEYIDSDYPQYEITNQEFPLFVTWNRDNNLRGCLGTFSALPLKSGLREYAISSAIRDSRFNPIILPSLPKLSCSVSLLTNFEAAADYLDWEIGTHGIRIEFNDGSCRRLATFLPEVMVDQGFSKNEAIEQLIRKSGCESKFIDYSFIQLTRYQSSKVTVTYDEWLSFTKSGNKSSNGN